MSERTTIGGVVYESVGSSSSNLLLKCNGTARIQWGNKLIDLIRNGKLASESANTTVSIISQESDIKSDGIYLLNNDTSSQLWISKDGQNYNITSENLYISALNKQDITAEQKYQALENIGIYYNTLEELQEAQLQNGVAYVIQDQTLYTIKNGVIKEFQATMKTVSVEVNNNNDNGEYISNTVKIIISVSGQDYLIFTNQRIVANFPVYIKDSAFLGSEYATDTSGYKLYMQGDKSYLDVDYINVRSGLPSQEYVEITFEELLKAMERATLQKGRLYLLKDYQNPWKLAKKSSEFRPLLIRAKTNKELYSEGTLADNRQIAVRYDHKFQNAVYQSNDAGGALVTAKGRITWMKDANENESNFDFLDYTDSDGVPFTTLHEVNDGLSTVLSIFPKNSFNNKLIVSNVRGLTIINGQVDITNTNVVAIHADCVMHDNTINCFGLVIEDSCVEFTNNVMNNVGKIKITNNFTNNTMSNVYTTIDGSVVGDLNTVSSSLLEEVIFPKEVRNTTLRSFVNSVCDLLIDSTFEHVMNCQFLGSFNNVKFKSLTNCSFDPGLLYNIRCYSDLNSHSFTDDNTILYDSSKAKSIYYNKTLQIISEIDHTFSRGMIMMHSGITPIPEGWAICDGNTYEYCGVTTKTPDLTNRFIKAVTEVAQVGSNNNSDVDLDNFFQLSKEHLPAHNHPHKSHSHTISGKGVGELNTTIQALTTATDKIVEVAPGESSIYTGEETASGDIIIKTAVETSVTGNTSKVTSVESDQLWENKKFRIEPNSYSLIFIIKL